MRFEQVGIKGPCLNGGFVKKAQSISALRIGGQYDGRIVVHG